MRIRCLLLIITIAFVMLAATQTKVSAQRKSVSAAEVTGTFRMSFNGKFRSMGTQIKIRALGGGKLRVAMDLVYPYTLRNGEMSANMGTLDDDFAIAGDTAVYLSDDRACTITLKFTKPGTVKVTQNGTDAACGFGFNVNAAGTYRKISSRKPSFESN